MNKLWKSFFLFSLVTGSLFFANKAMAAEKVTLAPNTEVEGKVTKDVKTIFYEMTVDKTGYQNFVFEVGEGDFDLIQSGWVLRLFDENNVNFYDETLKEKEAKVGKFTFAKGSKIKAEVSFYDEGFIPELPFKVKLETEEENDYEVEDNDILRKANKIKNKKEIVGNSFHGKDTDFYVYTIPENGVTNVKFQIPDFNSDLVQSGWDVKLFDSNKKKVFEYTGVQNEFSMPEITFKKGTKIYISVEPNSDYVSFVPKFVDYEIKIETKKTSAWEREDNNNFKKATSFGKGKKGYLLNMDDVDFYVLKANKTKKYKLSFEAEEGDAYPHIITVYVGKKGNKVASKEIKEEGSFSFKAKKGQTIWIKVDMGYYYYGAKNEYELKIK